VSPDASESATGSGSLTATGAGEVGAFFFMAVLFFFA
jgi:hypothetical protein